jgi:metal-responsive CopG/Arc/MetJ family transcriptional regulator
MRTLVDIPDRQIDALAALSLASKVSRAEIIRRAIAAYIEQNRTGAEAAFGIWKGAPEDGLAYQERVRSEW